MGDSDDSYNLKVTHFKNDDLLIGDSKSDDTPSVIGRIVLTRINSCGEIIWSYQYERPGEYLEFKDFKLDEEDNIYAYGSAFIGFDERIFLMKVDPSGGLLRFHLFQTETVDRFSFSLDLFENRLVIYGQLLGFQTQKQGFIALFDQGLQFRWGKRFTPFESYGNGLFTSDGGFIGWSGPYFYRFDQDGQLLWGQKVLSELGSPLPIAGPIAIEGGFVFQVGKNEQSSFIMLDDSGELKWSTLTIPTTFPSQFEQFNDQILVNYFQTVNDVQTIQLVDLTKSGELENARQLQHDYRLEIEQMSVHLSSNGHLAMIANAPFQANSGVEDFLIQFEIDEPFKDTCFSWVPYSPVQSPSLAIEFELIDTPVVETTMTLLPVTETDVSLYEHTDYLDLCDPFSNPDSILYDTIMDCGTDWIVYLPSEDFYWEDGFDGEIRSIKYPGNYYAKSAICDRSVVLGYQLAKPSCACNVYLSNAFTPNADGVNDKLHLQSDCQVESMHFLLYDRWGNRIYQAQHGTEGWDGTIQNQKPVPGIYFVQINYELRNENNEIQIGQIAQEISILY